MQATLTREDTMMNAGTEEKTVTLTFRNVHEDDREAISRLPDHIDVEGHYTGALLILMWAVVDHSQGRAPYATWDEVRGEGYR